jgi:hypothetical protein
VGRRDARVGLPEHVFRLSIDAVFDRLRRAGVSTIVLVGPVPDPARLEVSRRYSRVAAECAAEHHVPYVDLHGLLAGGDGWRSNFAAGPDGEAVTGPYPTAEALERVAAAVADGL